MSQPDKSSLPGSGDNAAMRKELKGVFDHLDHDKDGSLNFSELQKGFQDAGLVIDDSQIRKMIEVADDNKNHTIEFEEFYQIGSKAHKQDLNAISEYWLQFSNKPVVKEALVASAAPAWKLLVAGGVAGAVSRTCTSPLERLKILNQIEGMQTSASSSTATSTPTPTSSTTTQPLPPKPRRGVIPSLMYMWRTEGVMGFFKGNGTNVVRIVPYSAIQFFSYENYKRMAMTMHAEQLGYAPMHLTPIQNLLCGGMAGITSLLFTYPLDLIRSRLTVQITGDHYHGIIGTGMTVIREEGARGLYKGMFTSILGVAPYVAINFTSYETIKQYIITGNRSPTVPESLAFGAVAGAIAQTCTYPIDLLRRRMQTQGMAGAPKLYKGPWDAAKKIVKADGVMALYRGMVPCYLKVIPAISISFAVYELMRGMLGIESKKVSIHT